MGTCFMIYSYISPGTAVEIAALVAGDASSALNRTNTKFMFNKYMFRTNTKDIFME